MRRRSMMGKKQKAVEMIKRNLLFWFDGKDNNADGSHDLNLSYWKIKDVGDPRIPSSYSLALYGHSVWLPDGGISFPPNDSIVQSTPTPYYYLSHSVYDFTIETTCDIMENPYLSETGEHYIWGSSYGNNNSMYYRGGLKYENSTKQIAFSYWDAQWNFIYFDCLVEPGIHVYTLKKEGTTLSFYMDGVFKSSGTIDQFYRLPNGPHNSLCLGSYSQGMPGCGLGKFYCFKVYNTGLTNAEIQQSSKHSLQSYK